MKQFILIFFFSLSFSCYAQNFHLTINGLNPAETQVIDSTNYSKTHKNTKFLLDEIKITSQKLSRKGYIDNQATTTTKTNDSTYNTLIILKKQITSIHLNIKSINSIFNLETKKNDNIIIPYNEIENYLSKITVDAEKQGYALSKLKLENIRRKNQIIYSDLKFESEKKRVINSIIIKYQNTTKTDYFPKGHLKQLNKKYTHKTFNQETLKELYTDINNYEFLNQTKYPEILFTNDSTKIYSYIEKRKANTFDGYIGFSNEENKKIRLNGYLDITLLNTLHSGEQFSLYWKSDGNQQQSFNTKIEIPYIFQSPLGIKAQLNIFKQDSTFQNTKTSIDLGYYLKYNSKIYLGYQATESSNIQNTNDSTISDYKNSFTTLTFDYTENNDSNDLFYKKANIYSTIGFGKRNTSNSTLSTKTTPQLLLNLNLSYNFEINKKNFFFTNLQSQYLKSKNYITNELFRFGGLKSIRGFAENSLQGNNINLLLTEYRFLTSQNLYIHSILDYGLYQDQTNPASPKKINTLFSAGLGLGLLTKNGLLKITIANGSTNKTEIKPYNSILNINYNVKF
ncbi:ShlB/FhaC/HecB family hemolysin secretion/activation protein [Flavobacterium sp. FlaQc-30]|uniref:ShlB/FhaC/HecB family hemolysin secretion/activation protein n=1 Tax=Flavobacterium sp. FlaQc-30 TaxID=3374179 RepID=UPI0037572A88